MKIQTSLLALTSLWLLAGCGEDSKAPAAPSETEKAEIAKAETPPAPDKAQPEDENIKLVMPDACSLLDAKDVAAAAGWKSAQMKAVNTGVEYLAGCEYTDAADAKHVVKAQIAYGALIPDDSEKYAALVGDKDGTLKQPASPVTTFGVPTIEMDGGDYHSMQTRMEPTTEITVTTPTLSATHVLFPKALVRMKEIIDTDAKNKKDKASKKKT